MKTSQATYQITINQRNVTNDLSPYVTSITYADNIQGTASEVTVMLDNADKRFSNEWFISPRQVISLGIDGMNLGNFTIDMNGEDGNKGGHTAHFSAQSAGYTPQVRSKTSFTHANKSLASIVNYYAKKHSWKVVGTPPDLNFDIMIQTRESDIDFLHKLGRRYGCIVSLKGSVLVFDSIENVWEGQAKAKLLLTDDMSYSFTSELADSPDAAVNVYNDATNETVVGATTQVAAFSGKINNPFNKSLTANNWHPPLTYYKNLDSNYQVPSVFVHLDYHKVASPQEAARITMGKVVNGQLRKFNCTITTPGNILYVAGNLIDIEQVGKRSGLWLIESSIHKLDKKGAFVSIINGSHGLASSNGRAAQAAKITPQINNPEYRPHLIVNRGTGGVYGSGDGS